MKQKKLQVDEEKRGERAQINKRDTTVDATEIQKS